MKSYMGYLDEGRETEIANARSRGGSQRNKVSADDQSDSMTTEKVPSMTKDS